MPPSVTHLRSPRLYWRIVLPFVLGLVLVMGTGTLLANYLLARDADRRLEAHLHSVAKRVADAGFVLNQPLLERLKVAVGAEVIVCDLDGSVHAATFDGPDASDAAALVVTGAARGPSMSSPRVRQVTLGGRHYKLVWAATPVRATSAQFLAFFAPLEPIEAARAAIAKTLALVALGGLLLMLGWGHAITRSITRPLGRLIASMQAVAGGDLHHVTPPARIPEFLALSRAFDHMVGKIRESEARLVRSERLAATGQIVATVAHEVRNPLAAIRMLAQLLGRYHAEGTQPGEACHHIIAEIDRLEMLVQGLLAATHARPIRREPVQIAAVLQDVLDLVTMQFRHRNITLDLRLSNPLPPVLGDAAQLKQVFLNLLLNAADAMPNGGPVRISVIPTADGPSVQTGLEILVEDSGSGLSRDLQPRVFEPLVSTKPEGAGLGLAVCHRILREHGGSVTLENRAVGGAAALVWLPTRPPGALSDPGPGLTLPVEAPWHAS